MTPLDILTATRERLSDPQNWAKAAVARSGPTEGNRYGRYCGVNSDRAVAWSLGGALLLEGLGAYEARQEAVALVRTAAGCKNIGIWNDSVQHEDVLEALDEAIRMCA